MKKCNKCLEYKDESEFYKPKHVCKKCYLDKSKIKSHLEIRKETFDRIKVYCVENNGKCLEKEYLGGNKKHKVICEKNHEFHLYLDAINKKTWCPKCNSILRLNKTFEKIKEFCTSKEGVCLDVAYKPKKKIKVKCKQNHIFYLNWKHSASMGAWCPYCTNKKDAIDEMKLINDKCKEKGGQCLEQKYKGCKHKYKVKCDKDHIFMMNWQETKTNGNWCPYCSGRFVENEEDAMQEIHAFCESKKGSCLETKFKGIEKKYKCKCQHGHTFDMHWGSSKKCGYWCPYCANVAPKTIQETNDFVKENHPKAKLLSTIYKNNTTKLKLICGKGHKFTSSWANLQSNHWCPKCAGSRGEELVRKAFESKFNKPFPKIKPKWLINPQTNYRLELDGFNEELKIAFEYQGMQHYKIVSKFKMNQKRLDAQ